MYVCARVGADRAIWHRIVFVGEEVPKLMGHSACVFGNYVVIFGGHTSSKFCSDTYVLDFSECCRLLLHLLGELLFAPST